MRHHISILLVENDPEVVRSIGEMLKETEYAATPFRHAATLQEALNAGPGTGTVACVLLNLHLPDSKGIETLRRVRDVFNDSAIVVLTQDHDDELAIQAFQEGAQNHLAKTELEAPRLGRRIRHSVERQDFLLRLREADREMVLRERRFRALVEHSSDLTLLMGDDGTITYTSPMVARTFGMDAVDERVVNMISYCDPLDAAGALTCFQEALANPGKPFPLVIRAKQGVGEQVWLEGTVTNLLDVPGVWSMVANFHDITSHRKADMELQRNNAGLEIRVEQRTSELRKAEVELREALRAEREINDLKSRFVSMASHEFRTPLSAIMSSVDLIARYTADPGSEKIDRNVARIRGKVRELTGILNEFLSVEKLEHGLAQCDPQDFDLIQLCAELVEEMNHMTKAGQVIQYEHEGRERLVRTDRQMLANVLRNLLSNAIKYSPEEARISLVSGSEEGHVWMKVVDQGIGIPFEDQQYLFDRFFRASNASTTQGTGLGLHIVRRYLDLMRGSIHFTSGSGTGTTFTVDLPQTLEL